MNTAVTSFAKQSPFEQSRLVLEAEIDEFLPALVVFVQGYAESEAMCSISFMVSSSNGLWAW